MDLTTDQFSKLVSEEMKINAALVIAAGIKVD